jgi:hypothetical protein
MKWNFMVKKLFIFCGVVGVVLGGAFFVKHALERPYYMDVTTHGDDFVVSAYTLKSPVKFHYLYEERADLDRYKWLVPILYTKTDYAGYIPETDWPLYEAEGPGWTPERFAERRAGWQRIRRNRGEAQYAKEYKQYKQIERVVLCKSKKLGIFLSVYMKTMDGDNQPTGLASSSQMMKKGTSWRMYDVPEGRDHLAFNREIEECRSKAFEALEKGELKSRDIKWMKE